jgi:hypothetical protein
MRLVDTDRLLWVHEQCAYRIQVSRVAPAAHGPTSALWSDEVDAAAPLLAEE